MIVAVHKQEAAVQFGRSEDQLKTTRQWWGAAAAEVSRHSFAPTLCLALLLGSPWAVAQARSSADTEAMERAKRAAESPMRWIKLQAESAKTVAPAAKPVPSTKRAVSVATPAKPRAAQASKAASDEATVATAPEEPSSALEVVVASAPMANAGPPRAQEIVALDRVDPQWGEALMQSLRKGRVVVSFEVNAEGQLLRSRVVSSTSPRLDTVALAALRQWQFQPMDKTRGATAEFGFDLAREQPSAPQELVLIDQAEPSWDPSLMETVRQGQVRVRIEVDVDGRLAHAEVASSSDKRLDAVALDAIRRWRFQPLEQRRAATVEVGFDLDRKTP